MARRTHASKKRSTRAAKGGTSARGRTRRPKMAETADRHALYQEAVQAPEGDVAFFDRTFRKLRGRRPRRLREDFCGTAHLAVTWAASGRGRTAVGVDIDRRTLEWGRAHNVAAAGPKVARRVELVCDDVRRAVTAPADLVCAMNFSYCVFHTREELRAYFAAAHRALVDDGLFVAELYGGLEAIRPLEESRRCKGFTYVWEQESFDPITHRTVCHIHFRFPDRSRIERAFTYDWRLWTIPEVREVMAEAGFVESVVYWEAVDEDGDGNGEYYRTDHEEQQESFLCYVIGLK